jgi:hypothetical protein
MIVEFTPFDSAFTDTSHMSREPSRELTISAVQGACYDDSTIEALAGMVKQ